jgi:hypothetical protein
MANTTQSPVHVREHAAYSLHRAAVASADAAPPVIATTTKTQGINMAGYEEAIIAVEPITGVGNPAVSIYWWNEASQEWAQDHTLLTFAAAGAGVTWTEVIACKHRRMFVALTGTLTGGVNVRVAGHRNVVESM